MGKDLQSLPNDIKCDDSMRSQHIPTSINGFYQSLNNTKLSLVTLEMPISFSAEISFFIKHSVFHLKKADWELERQTDIFVRSIPMGVYTVGWGMEIDKIGPLLNSTKINSLTHQKLSVFEH